MEGNLQGSGMFPGASYGVMDLQGNMHLNHQHNSQQQQQWQSSFPNLGSESAQNSFLMGKQMQESDQQVGISVRSSIKGKHGKMSVSDEEHSFTEEGTDTRNEGGKEKKESPWHRMKWTDAMVKLLITAVSYVGEDTTEGGNGGRRKHAALQKKGKWKAISEVMAERGCFVSPQQCEDKFNDLNKRYKRLTEILGRGTSCKVVENPELLDQLNHVSDKLKEVARKILSSKHLFYEEMCSYHNCNRLNLPADPGLQRSLQLALRCKEPETQKGALEDIDEDDQSIDSDSDSDEFDAEDHNVYHGEIGQSCGLKRIKLPVECEEAAHGNPQSLPDCTRSLRVQGISVDMNQLYSEGCDSRGSKQLFGSRSLELEDKKLRIEAQKIELERKRLKWQNFSKKKDKELERMRMENEKMKIDNRKLALEIRERELELERLSKSSH